MACEVMMNHSVEVPTVDALYHQGPWTQPLSPELGSPVHAQSPHGSVYSPTSPVLSHAGSPLGCYSPEHSPVLNAVHSPQSYPHAGSPLGCCSPVHSPVLNAVHSPQSYISSPPPLEHIIKHEHLPGCDELGYATSDNSRSLSTLLRNSNQELNCAVSSCHFGAGREILDGESKCA